MIEVFISDAETIHMVDSVASPGFSKDHLIAALKEKGIPIQPSVSGRIGVGKGTLIEYYDMDRMGTVYRWSEQ